MIEPLAVTTGMRPLTSAQEANSELIRLETEDWQVDEMPDRSEDASAAVAVEANARAVVTARGGTGQHRDEFWRLSERKGSQPRFARKPHVRVPFRRARRCKRRNGRTEAGSCDEIFST